MRHAASFTVGAGIVLAAFIATDSLLAASDGAGQVWVVPRGSLAAALAGNDLRVVDLFAGGRVAVLHAARVGTRLPARSAWLALRLPAGAFAMPGCA